jgi:cyclohexadieny/prephenate dehydrogenase
VSQPAEQPFRRIAVVGMGLIGSSLARVARREGLAERVVGIDRDPTVIATVERLGICDEVGEAPILAKGADLVVFAVPVGVVAAAAAAIAPHLAPGTIVSDTGSVKQAVIQQLQAVLPAHVRLVPAHPVAGTEHSGPEHGFAEMFEGRLTILTPLPATNRDATRRVAWLWERAGSRVEEMPPEHHDRVLAVTSHLPHLIAYTIVATAADLEDHLQADVIKFSAGGFRDFTRIAASDPVMWRDIFLHNREAVLEMLGRLYEDIALLQRAIRIGDGQTLYDHFVRSRAIRREVVAARQDVGPAPKGS